MPTLFLAQDFKHIKLEVLSTQLQYSNRDIKTKFEGDKIYYFNANENTKLFSKGFEMGYPFFLNSAIVKQNGKYGIIDTNGDYLIKPIYENFKLAPYENECYFVIFNSTTIFNLNKGIRDASYTYCEELASPEVYAFVGKNKKLGVKKKETVIIKPVYDTIYAVETDFILASKNKKIGIITLKKEQLIDFEFDEAQYSKCPYYDCIYPIFGLRKKNTWTYFENGQKLLDSNYKCTSFSTTLENSIGIFDKKGKKNILFKNGTTLNKPYDFISQNGLIGTIKNKVFKLKSDGTNELYFQEN